MTDEDDGPEHVRAAVHAAGLGDVERMERAGAGQRNDAWLVDAAAGSVVVRLLHDADRLEMETAVLSLAAGAGVPVAEVLFAASVPRPVMVQQRLAGRRLADVRPSDELCASVARTLRAIHQIPIASGFGTLQGDLTGSAPQLSTWFTEHVRAEASSATIVAGPDDLRRLQRALDELDLARSLLDAQEPGLVHGDIQPFNLLVERNRVTGVLDWEAAKSGPPAFDFGWWDWFSVAWGTPWRTSAIVDHYVSDGDADDAIGDRRAFDELRRLVVHRVWTRELVTALRKGDESRAAAARDGLRSSSGVRGR